MIVIKASSNNFIINTIITMISIIFLNLFLLFLKNVPKYGRHIYLRCSKHMNDCVRNSHRITIKGVNDTKSQGTTNNVSTKFNKPFVFFAMIV